MREQDSSFTADGPDQFASTLWSDVLVAADPASPENRIRMERLLQRYWKPVYLYIRTGWRRTIEDAKDLTQSFFAHILERNLVARVSPEGGSFRGYLKRALRNFIIDQARAEAARRPQGRAIHLEGDPAEMERLNAIAASESPDHIYDREWFHGLLRSCGEDLRRWLTDRGKAIHFEVFRRYCLDATAASPTYGSVASQLGLKESDVRHHLEYCRQLFQKCLKMKIRDYVEKDEDVERELRQVIEG